MDNITYYDDPRDDPLNANLPVINQPASIIGITSTFLCIAVIAATFRIYARIRERLFGRDDLFVCLAAFGTSVGSCLICFMPKHSGLGLHLISLSEKTMIEYFKFIWATNLTYTSSTSFIKLAILFQYLRLFDFQSKGARRVTWAMIVMVSVWGTSFFFLVLFSCRPIAKFWHWTLPGTCVAWGSKDPVVFFPVWATHSATNMLLDILILVLPIPFLRGLRMQGRTRVGLIGLFIVGTIVTSMSVCRMVALSLTRAGTIPYPNMTYHTPAVFVFSVLEVNLAIMLASIPIFWPLVISFASNKILVVNEVEVRTDVRDSQAIGFSDSGACPGFELRGELDKGGRSSRVSTIDNMKEPKAVKELSRLKKSLSRRHQKPHHTQIKSNPSSRHTPSLSLTPTNRMSSESQQNLAHQPSSTALSSFSSSPQEQASSGLDPTRNTSITHYQDRYVQHWVTGFDKNGATVGDNHGAGPHRDTGNRTVVERAEIPFDHLRHADK